MGVPEKDPVNLGYTNIGNNANGNPSASASVFKSGVLGKQWQVGAMGDSGLRNESEATADTQVMATDGSGTVESGGING